jgi:hypothetical protein
MVMEDNEHPPAPIMEAPAPEAVERPLWKLSRDEQRVLIITFIGGLASIVAGVCVIGGAIALVRLMKASHFSLLTLFVLTALYSLGWILIEISIRRLRRLRRHSSSDLPGWLGTPTGRAWLVSTLVMGVGVSIVLLLVWIGIAAGIH